MSFLKNLSWATLVLVVGCEASKPAPTPATMATTSTVTQAPQALIQTPVPEAERYAAAPTDAEIATLMGAPPMPEVGMMAIRAELDAEMAQFQYQPSSTLAPSAEPETPLRGSFAADLKEFTQRIKQAYGNTAVLVCTFPPCVQRGDFDGDGQADWAVQVAEPTKLKTGVAFVLGNNTQSLLAAGTPSALGEDLTWVSSWSLGTVQQAGTSGPGTVATTVLRFNGTNDQGGAQSAKAYFARATTGGPTQMSANWESPSSQ